MANPQPDEFTKIANELFAAIMQTDFSKRQRKIIDLVIRMSYGCNKKYALLRHIDFELVGVSKTDIKKELEYLKAAKVLQIDGECFVLNKDYDQWRVDLVRGSSSERLAQVLKRNRLHQVGEIPTEVGKMPTLENEAVGKTLTEVGKIPTIQDPDVVGKIPTGTPLESSDINGFQPRKEKDLKDLKNKAIAIATTTTDLSDQGQDLLLELESLASQVLGRPIPSPNDITAMRQMLMATGGDVGLIRQKVLEMARNYKTKFPGSGIKTFAYFLPGVLEEVARRKARAAPLDMGRASPPSQPQTPQKSVADKYNPFYDVLQEVQNGNNR